MECKKDKNLENCPCSYLDCPRKGICCECIKYHRDKGHFPACFFSAEAEETYDRSFEKLVADRKKLAEEGIDREIN